MPEPILHLAPMCNITNRATREIAKEFGCDVTWSEMISSEGLVRQNLKNNKSLGLAKKFSEQESPYWVQIFGTDPQTMAQAAKIIEREIKPDGIDINLGCPVPKAKKGGYGAIQIKNIPQVIKIIKAIKREITIPLSLKTRLGLVNSKEILKFAPMLEKAGIDQLVIHARTLKGLFSAEPDWKIVKQLNNILSIPTIYNGGIKTAEDAKFYFKRTGCQNLMIGQAAIGNPWIFQKIKKGLRPGFSKSRFDEVGACKHKTQLLNPDTFTLINKKSTLLKHANLVIQNYGSEKGLIGFRSQLSVYLRTLQAPKRIRKQATQITSISELEKLLDKI